ncbi:similar to Saccharomyces cerevisiae YOL112W MSB4 GTPase-activating protein of the Ras superfamily that acts primarily on Sec4p [Maudiozyma saulgeensis]|uniref:Similar to Saccharomyces cerevisiae YOL112W MSB4 GTPase-activating protein of the Ras superfamily that acts primarily on Sec4p n=1 Tax=Maudiozyma saulgeensis TaxID=1789683 RepID=A0A1X7R1H6_9SACH|nr:similar to Saccharomyces cerevisiae YOL112W MSB4 GTPase-activating protein of the Ras superfamily that acts primarily on Sec4p [Kazachstania saulgeensis]
MQKEQSRISYNGIQNGGLVKPPVFIPRVIPRSPSVPSLQNDRSFNALNASDPMLNRPLFEDSTKLTPSNKTRLEPDFNPSPVQGSPSTIGGNSNLSVIDMYGDDTESQMASEESDDSPRTNSYTPINEISDNSNIIDDKNIPQLMHRLSLSDTTNKTNNEDNDDEYHKQPIPKSPRVNISSKDAENFDRYGFKKQTTYITEQEYDVWWKEYYQYCNRRKNKWIQLMEKYDLSTKDESIRRFPPKSEKLKRYVRKGIPAEWRGNAWWYFANGQQLLDENPSTYPQLLSKIDHIETLPDKETKYPDLEIIERDLNRTFPDNIHFQRESFQNTEPEMIKSLRRVLVAFSLYNTKIGYCQSMNFLAGLLLLFLDEEKSFWMLVLLTSKYLPGVHNVNLEGVNIDQGVLMLCVQEYLPAIWEYVVPSEKSNTNKTNLNKLMNSRFTPNHSHNKDPKNEFLFKLPPVTLCTASWFMSCFVGVLPIEVTLRIWDCLFYEGSHFLFKVSLGILKLSEGELLKGKHSNSLTHYTLNGNQNKERLNNPEENEMELFQIVQSFPKKILNPNDIFEKIIFKKRITFNNLDQDEIDRCRKYVTEQRQKHIPLSDNKKSLSHTNINDNSNSERSVSSQIGESGYKSLNVQKSKTMKQEHKSDEQLSGSQSEGYGFKRSITSVNWNSGLKQRVRQIRSKKD